MNSKSVPPSQVVSLITNCTKNSFHIILNLNGTLLRIVYTRCSDIFALKYEKDEFIIHPKIIGQANDIVEYKNIMEFWQNLRLEYQLKV